MRNRYFKLFLFLAMDFFVADISLIVSCLAFDRKVFAEVSYTFIGSLFLFPALLLAIFYILKVYNILWRFAGTNEYIRIAAGVAFSSLALYVIQSAIGYTFPTITFLSTALFLTSLLYCTRLCAKQIMDSASKSQVNDAITGNIMIIGAGSAGYALINDINANKHLRLCKIRCIIDDDPAKRDKYICGAHHIIGGCDQIVSAAEKYKIDMIIFAIPSCPSERKSAILRICQQTNCTVKIIPSIYQLITESEVKVEALRKVEIEDLLGRDPINLNLDSVMKYVKDKTVLVTGGGGSIGSELCRQLAMHLPKTLIIFDIYENNAYDIQNELARDFPDIHLVTLIGSVRDKRRLDCVFEKYHPDIVYHAAAHKHVPLMEDSPNESIKNNVFGTANVAECAHKYGVQKFVLISTDKAVNPTNIMGASKRICEMIVQLYNGHSDTEFVAVRFGNVLGSNGSVIPLFKRQIELGGPVTVTDPNIIRYFMTIPEAVSLVLQAGASAKGGEIFVLDMGEPVKILDLAENLIRLSGYKPYTDIRIEFTGLRPGEKLYEEMLMSEEGLSKTDNRLIYIGKPIEFDEDELWSTLSAMEKSMTDDNCDVRPLVKRIVPTYSYSQPVTNS